MQETRVRSLGREDPLEKAMAPHSSTLAWKIHGRRSLIGYSPWGCKESGTTEWLDFTVILLHQWFSARGRISQGPSGNVWKHFWLLQPGSCNCHLGTEARAVSQHQTVRRPVSHSKELASPEVSHAQVDRSCPPQSYLKLRTFPLFLVHPIVRSVT